MVLWNQVTFWLFLFTSLIFQLPSSRSFYEILMEHNVSETMGILLKNQTSNPMLSIENFIKMGMDNSIDPCTDFYSYACGGMRKSQTEGYLNHVKNDLAKTKMNLVKKQPSSSQISRFYKSCLYSYNFSKWNLESVYVLLEKFLSLKTIEEIVHQFGYLSQYAPKPFGLTPLGIVAIPLESNLVNAFVLDVKSFVVDVESYLLSMKAMVFKVKVFSSLANSTDHMMNLALGVENFIHDLQTLQSLVFQTNLFNDTVLSFQEMEEMFPLVLATYMKGLVGKNRQHQISFVTNDYTNTYLYHLEQMYTTLSMDVLKLCMSTMFLETFEIYEKSSLSFHSSLNESECACLQITNFAFSKEIDQVYLYQNNQEIQTQQEQLFPMIKKIKAVFQNELTNKPTWFDRETHNNVLHKLANMTFVVGDNNPNESNQNLFENRNQLIRTEQTEQEQSKQTEQKVVSDRDFIANLMNVFKIRLDQQFDTLGKPPELNLPVAIVNAFYDSSLNLIYLPSPLLQPPFYHSSYPLAMIYGTVGYIIAHEMYHSFDSYSMYQDQLFGRQPWGSETTRKKILEKWKCFEDLYSSMEVRGNNNNTWIGQVNGIQTLAENLADSGMDLAFLALQEEHKSIEETPFLQNTISSKKLFFVATAQIWCQNPNDQELKEQLQHDVHSPAQPRVNGLIMNSNMFPQVFHCPLGSPMNPEKKCPYLLSFQSTPLT